MIAAIIKSPELLPIEERPDPQPGRGEVRVRVRATAVNRADLLQRMGAYPAPADSPPDIPGLEFAGEVATPGETWKVGDRVFGLVGGGAYASALVTHERALARVPDGMSFTDAAACPEAFITAWDAIVTQAGLAAGETLLVQAAGSGVGTAAVQIAKAIGARSVGTSRTADKLPRLAALGMDEGLIVGADGKFADRVRPDVILELVGGSYLAEDLRAAAPLGRVVLVGMMGGTRAELDQTLIMRKRLRIIGTVLRSRPLEEKIAAMQAFARHVVPLLASGALKPVVDRVFPIADAIAAHAYVASNVGFGKVVLTLPDPRAA